MIRAVLFDMFETLVTLNAGGYYFNEDMARDAGIQEDFFRGIWSKSEYDRTVGKMTMEEAVEIALKEAGKYSEELFQSIIVKRREAKKRPFSECCMHPEIFPMLQMLREKGILIGLISNCFSEEAEVIHESRLYPLFDSPMLSYEQGICKPDREIFDRCLKKLGVSADECFYVGDGGSRELEISEQLGMKPFQAVWYLREGANQPCGRLDRFRQLERPLELIGYLE